MLFLSFILIISSQLVLADINQPLDSDVYLLEHAIDSNDFKEIGSLNLKQIKQNQYAAQFQSYNSNQDTHEFNSNSSPGTPSTTTSTQIETNQFDQLTKQQIKQAFKQNLNSVYRLRLVKKQQQQQQNGVVYVASSSFTYLKYLIESDFMLNLTLNTGFTGRLNSISIKTYCTGLLLNSIDNKEQSKRLDDFDYLTLYATVQNIKPGQTPETDVYLEKLKKEIEQKEKGAQGENQSFFAKYWIYIVPFVVVMFLMNLANPEGAAPAR